MRKKTFWGGPMSIKMSKESHTSLELGACLGEWERYNLFSFHSPHSYTQELVFFFSFHEKQESSFNGKLQALMKSSKL